MLRIKELEYRIFQFYHKYRGVSAPFDREVETWWRELDVLYREEQ